MNKRTKKRVKIGVGIFFGILAITLVLVGIGFKQLLVHQIGLDYNLITGSINNQTVYQTGIHYISLSHRFIKFNRTTQTEYFQNVSAMTSDQIVTVLNVHVQYLLTFTTSPSSLIDYYIMFGENPAVILRPVFFNAIQLAMSTYTLPMLQTFNDTLLSSLIKRNIDTALIPLVSLTTLVSIDSITSNYQNKTASSEIAYLKRKSENLVSLLAGIGAFASNGDYRYQVAQALSQANTSSLNRRYLETNQTSQVIANLGAASNNIGAIRLYSQLISGNQSYFQDMYWNNIVSAMFPAV